MYFLEVDNVWALAQRSYTSSAVLQHHYHFHLQRSLIIDKILEFQHHAKVICLHFRMIQNIINPVIFSQFSAYIYHRRVESLVPQKRLLKIILINCTVYSMDYGNVCSLYPSCYSMSNTVGTSVGFVDYFLVFIPK